MSKQDDHVAIPVWGGCYTPYRLIAREGDVWNVKLKDVNERSYDNAKLFRTSLNIDVGIRPYSLAVLFDGTLVIPRFSQITKSVAIDIFNDHLAKLTLSGLYCHEISPDDVTPGSMNIWGYHRHGAAAGRYTTLSQSLRTRSCLTALPAA